MGTALVCVAIARLGAEILAPNALTYESGEAIWRLKNHLLRLKTPVLAYPMYSM